MTDGGPRYSPCCGLRLLEIGRASPDLMEPERLLRCPGCGQTMAVSIEWLRDESRFTGVAGWLLRRVPKDTPAPVASAPDPVPKPPRRRVFSWFRGGHLFAG